MVVELFEKEPAPRVSDVLPFASHEDRCEECLLQVLQLASDLINERLDEAAAAEAAVAEEVCGGRA